MSSKPGILIVASVLATCTHCSAVIEEQNRALPSGQTPTISPSWEGMSPPFEAVFELRIKEAQTEIDPKWLEDPRDDAKVLTCDTCNRSEDVQVLSEQPKFWVDGVMVSTGTRPECKRLNFDDFCIPRSGLVTLPVTAESIIFDSLTAKTQTNHSATSGSREQQKRRVELDLLSWINNGRTSLEPIKSISLDGQPICDIRWYLGSDEGVVTQEISLGNGTVLPDTHWSVGMRVTTHVRYVPLKAGDSSTNRVAKTLRSTAIQKDDFEQAIQTALTLSRLLLPPGPLLQS